MKLTETLADAQKNAGNTGEFNQAITIVPLEKELAEKSDRFKKLQPADAKNGFHWPLKKCRIPSF